MGIAIVGGEKARLDFDRGVCYNRANERSVSMEKNSQSRFQNTWKNFRFGVAAQIVISLLGFLSRTIFIHVLSEEYLGINGLYASILNVLSLTELGLSDIVVYSLYKPLAQGDEKQLTALMGYYKTIYRIIALAVAVIGLGLVPVLRLLVKSTIDQYHLVLYYLMFLANSVCSYLLVYKSSIIHADQKRYLISRYEICFKFLSVAAQIMVLLLFRNFTVYLFIQIAMTVVSNLFISRKADQLYPFLKEKAPLEPETKKNIFRDVRHMFSYKAGGQLLNSTDNLYISTLISTATVGQYDNYVMIQGMVSAYTTIISQSVLGSLGNLNATGDRAQKKRVFDIYSMGFSWIAAFCMASLLVLYNPFILLWAGEKWLLPMDTVAVICLNFYLPNVLVPVWNFRNTSGLFRETKNILLYAAAINLVLSYFLGVKWVLTGILAETSISRLLTSFWFEPYILHKKIFETSCAPFFLRQGACLGIVVLSFAAITLVSSLCGLGVWGDFFLRGVLCLVIPNGLLLALNFRTEAFGYLKEKLLKKLGG